MKVLMRWIKCGEEEKEAFENSPEMTGMYLRQLKGRRWNVIRKIRVIGLIRRMIEEGIIVKGVEEIYKEGCRILSEMERGREGREEEEDEEEERYMCELSLLRVRGEQKKDEGILRKEVDEEKKKIDEEQRKREEVEARLEEANKKVIEERNRADEEKRKREEAELIIANMLRDKEIASRLRNKEVDRMQKEIEEMKKKIPASPPPPPSYTLPPTAIASSVITSLDRTSVVFPKRDGIKREGNTIINTSNDFRNCFIGGVMTSV